MTKQQKLTKVIERAVKNGWEGLWDEEPLNDGRLLVEATNDPYYYATFDENRFSMETILFSHDFAKAYWPKGKVELLTGKYNKDGPTTAFTPFWQFHLKNAVLAKDPIDYYYKNK